MHSCMSVLHTYKKKKSSKANIQQFLFGAGTSRHFKAVFTYIIYKYIYIYTRALGMTLCNVLYMCVYACVIQDFSVGYPF